MSRRLSDLSIEPGQPHSWNPSTEEVRSGQLDAPPGFSHWLLKFDGVSGNKDKELEDPQGYGLIEFAYSQMAQAAGITMTECRLT